MYSFRSLRSAIYTTFLLYSLLGFSSLHAQNLSPWTTFQLDGVKIGLAGSFRAGSKIHTSPSGDLAQVGSSVTWHPYREISVIAIPFGVKPGAEVVPVAEPGATSDYEQALRDFRASQGGIPQYAPTLRLFGRKTVGLSNLVLLNIDGPKPKYVSITEWVVEAGDRMWILRVGQEVKDRDEGEKAGDKLSDLALTTDETLHSRSTLVDALSQGEASPSISDEGHERMTKDTLADLPSPSWWNGSDCDGSHYNPASGKTAYRLGGR